MEIQKTSKELEVERYNRERAKLPKKKRDIATIKL